ncbi:MAG TPA: response regulator, partial [Geobacteraceae bacterium]|nr:response regulator [Geobacteraceae bacterium]
MTSQTPIGSFLVEEGIISAKTLERVLDAQKKSDKRLGTLLHELGIVTEDEIIEALGRQCRLRTIRRFADQTYARELLDLVPGELALQKQVFPLKQNDGVLAVAMCDPFDHATVEELANLTGMKIHLALATREELSAAVRKHYGGGRLRKRREKILLIDTSPVSVKSMQAALEDEGYEVLCAHDGIEGLKLAFVRQPDVVICELAMPRLDGYTFLHALKAH